MSSETTKPCNCSHYDDFVLDALYESFIDETELDELSNDHIRRRITLLQDFAGRLLKQEAVHRLYLVNQRVQQMDTLNHTSIRELNSKLESLAI